MNITMRRQATAALLGASALCAVAGTARADQVFNDDLIVVGSACIGQDCVNGENFGFDTLRLKENNLRIKFDDTSNSSSFPSNDWQLTANDTSNGGANRFSIDDVTGGRTPFTIEASAPSNALYVDDNGRIGLGTATPVVELHITNGDSPTLRLEQNGSSGFGVQTWDVAGNETNFFVRDATNGSTLPFRIRPSAPQNALYIDTDGDIGLGTASPDTALDIEGSDGGTSLIIQELSSTRAGREMIKLSNNGGSFITMENTAANGGTWFMTHENNAQARFFISHSDGGLQMALDKDGDMTILGALTTGGTTCGGGGCDRIFDADAVIPTIPQQHAMMFADRHLPAVGPTLENAPFDVTNKVGGMLHELEKAHIYIAELHQDQTRADATIASLTARLSAIETTLDAR